VRDGWIEKDPSSTDLIKTLRKLISLWERDLIEKNTLLQSFIVRPLNAQEQLLWAFFREKEKGL
jgi:hypothetical protein